MSLRRAFVIPLGRLGAALACAALLAGGACDARASTLKQIDRAALQAMVSSTAQELGVPGALVLLRTPQGDFVATYGSTVRGTDTPPTTDTHFRIASNTKTMTAAIILLLAQEEKLHLDDAVSKYVDGVPGGDAITLAQLLEMRSGLFNYTDAPELWASLEREPGKALSPADVLAMAFARPANAQPGTEYEYDNTNYALLGLVAEKADGKPLAQIMHDRLFAPLGMKSTLLPASGVKTIPEPFARGYGYGGTGIVLSDSVPYAPDVKAAASAGTLAPNDYTELNPSFATAAGGAISTADDLAVWIRALAGGRLLDADMQRRWRDSLKPEDPAKPDGQRYGFGISELRWGPNQILFHGGETPGYNSKIAHDAANELSLVIWTNMALSLDEQQPANTLMVRLLDLVYQQSPLAAGAPPSPALDVPSPAARAEGTRAPSAN